MSGSYTFQEMVSHTREAIAAFERVERRPWTVETSLIELSKQVGDLAKRVLTFERYYLPDRDRHPAYATTVDDIGNELADILYSIIRISLYYEIDLEEAHIEARRNELGYARQAAERYGVHQAPLGGRPSLADAVVRTPASRCKNHYETLLAKHYVWMAGGRDNGLQAGRRMLEGLSVGPVSGEPWALDLGSGPGFHALNLARLGYRVVAVDQCATLLDQLRQGGSQDRIDAVEGDIRDPGTFSGRGPYRLILCLGDTLLHLDTVAEAARLVADAAAQLEPDGRLILSMRDYSSELRGHERFLPVRSDADKVMTVCLDYAPDHIEVHDILYSRTGQDWVLTKGSYRKLRLTQAQVIDLFVSAGLVPRQSFSLEGFLHFVADKPSDLRV